MRIRISHALVVLFAASCTLALFLIAGCNGGGSGSSTTSPPQAPAPSSSATAIASCVVSSNNDVVIGGSDSNPGCDDVVMSPSSANPANFGEIRIEDGGTLTVTGAAASNETPVQEICIEDGGILNFGTQDNPVTDQNKVVLPFIGDRDSTPLTDQCQGFTKGIDVTAGATLSMYGVKGVPTRGGVSWTTLAAPAGSQVPGAKVASTGLTTLDLSADVTKGAEGWQPGDWIVVATTSFNPFDTEFVQIATVISGGTSGGSTVTLAQPLKYYHFGSPAPSTGTSAACPDRLGNPGSASYCDGADQNWGVDERAEVGLVSRDIELTAVTESAPTDPPPPATSSVHWGGEIMIEPGFNQVAIQGVRLSKFGKDRLGSYPIHFHEIGTIGASPNPTDQSALIDADSIDHSYNHCVTIHSTSDLTISNLVCARIVGHIFYEELMDASANNSAGDGGIVFDHDLGLGAMSYSFDIYAMASDTRQQLINEYWWTGDYMTNAECTVDHTCINYDGFNIPDTDNWLQAIHGSCTAYGTTVGMYGGFNGVYAAPSTSGNVACTSSSEPVYIEPASGFWIQNPDTVLTGDAIGGCQGVGTGFWWVAPPTPVLVNGTDVNLIFAPINTFKNNRASACYTGFYSDAEYSQTNSGQLQPRQGGQAAAASLIGSFDGMTATRNRFRGVWLRPTWLVINNGRFATNRDSVTLLTSGGIDGNAPGVWDLLENSVVVGISENNVNRWGPCPDQNEFGINTGGQYGCVDHTYPAQGTAHSGDEVGDGYAMPNWNVAGYMLYDGPVRVFHDRFVNFNYDDPQGTNDEFSGELDTADQQFLQQYSATFASPTGQTPFVYEGDAAFGWFQSNQNSYPTGTATKQLSFVNTNLRHQVYTAKVGLNTNFNDGDKNTAILDEDGTLSGLGVLLAPNSGSSPVYPISLNNLPFNNTSNSVDECLSEGGQNELYEGRSSALMSPATLGTLQFSSLYPDDGTFPGGTNSHWQQVTFTRDDEVSNGHGGTTHPTMLMRTGRNGLGSYEPKVSNGYGYTLAVAPTTVPGSPATGLAGVAPWASVTIADIVDPNISAAHPFFIQLGINYSNKDGTHPADEFNIERGYKSYDGAVWTRDPELLDYWTDLNCNNLDAINTANLPTQYGGQGYCPAASGGTVMALSSATNIGALTNTDGTPNMGVYYYDQPSGYLYFNVVQNVADPIGPSPTGSCDSADDGGNPDSTCPDLTAGETYYACPKNGCVMYTISMNDPSYDPGASVGAPDEADAKAPPASQNQLVVYGTDTIITRTEQLDQEGVPYYTADNGPNCTATEPQ